MSVAWAAANRDPRKAARPCGIADDEPTGGVVPTASRRRGITVVLVAYDRPDQRGTSVRRLAEG